MNCNAVISCCLVLSVLLGLKLRDWNWVLSQGNTTFNPRLNGEPLKSKEWTCKLMVSDSLYSSVKLHAGTPWKRKNICYGWTVLPVSTSFNKVVWEHRHKKRRAIVTHLKYWVIMGAHRSTEDRLPFINGSNLCSQFLSCDKPMVFCVMRV